MLRGVQLRLPKQVLFSSGQVGHCIVNRLIGLQNEIWKDQSNPQLPRSKKNVTHGLVPTSDHVIDSSATRRHVFDSGVSIFQISPCTIKFSAVSEYEYPLREMRSGDFGWETKRIGVFVSNDDCLRVCIIISAKSTGSFPTSSPSHSMGSSTSVEISVAPIWQ